MNADLTILIVEAMSVYFLVLWSHFLRNRAGLAPFYALIGGITAVISWVTDAGDRSNPLARVKASCCGTPLIRNQGLETDEEMAKLFQDA
jgi:hypothetical protein